MIPQPAELYAVVGERVCMVVGWDPDTMLPLLVMLGDVDVQPAPIPPPNTGRPVRYYLDYASAEGHAYARAIHRWHAQQDAQAEAERIIQEAAV
jgi:hypothetical protein